MKKKISLDYSDLESLACSILNRRNKAVFRLILETSCKASEISRIKILDYQSCKIGFEGWECSVSKETFRLVLEKEIFLKIKSLSSRRINQIIREETLKVYGSEISSKDLRAISIRHFLKAKKEAPCLKNFKPREYLSPGKIPVLRSVIKNDVERAIFELLLKGFKPKEIISLDVKDLSSFKGYLGRVLKKACRARRARKGSEKIFPFSRVRIFQIARSIGLRAGIMLNPRILNNTCEFLKLSIGSSLLEFEKSKIKFRPAEVFREFAEDER